MNPDGTESNLSVFAVRFKGRNELGEMLIEEFRFGKEFDYSDDSIL